MLRRSPRALLLWTGAVVVALATALLVGSDLAALHRRAAALGPEVEVAVATRNLPVGVTIDADDIRSRRVHRSQLPTGAVAPETANGRVVAVPVVRDAFVADDNLAPRHRTGLDGIVPPGMRVVRIVVAGPTADLRPGAAVDVLATFDTGAAVDPEGAAYGDPTVVVARGALVLATDDEVAAGAPAGDGLTLLVTEEEALAVSYASAAGIVAVALVPPEDARVPVQT
ncbi:MAG TPA: Flp pilus assembly protein CpaB [Acidimicrobiia bacterium]|nr:Flp pilus assembly protein CpaB [Acidimicrobiia bacterium]